MLLQFNNKLFLISQIVCINADFRCSRLIIPAGKLTQINVAGITHSSYKIFRSDSLTIMALKIQIHPFTEIFFPQYGMDHTNNFSSFIINRHGIKIINFHILCRTNRMSHRTRIFRKLMRTQNPDIINTFNGPRLHIRSKFLITKNR